MVACCSHGAVRTAVYIAQLRIQPNFFIYFFFVCETSRIRLFELSLESLQASSLARRGPWRPTRVAADRRGAPPRRSRHATPGSAFAARPVLEAWSRLEPVSRAESSLPHGAALLQACLRTMGRCNARRLRAARLSSLVCQPAAVLPVQCRG